MNAQKRWMTTAALLLAVLCFSACQPQVVEVEKEIVVTKVVEKEVIKEVEVEVETIVEKEVEVEVEKIVEKVVEVEVEVTAVPEPATIRIAMPTVSSFDQLDPHDAAGSNMGLLENMYQSLVAMDNDTLQANPSLAESWEVKDDDSRYIFNLRKGVTFHDGTDLTSDDVKLSFERILAIQKAYGWEKLERIQEIQTPDDYTVEFIIDAGPSPFPVLVDMVKIVSADAVREHEVDGDHAAAWFKGNVAGTGPYRLQEWRPNDRWVLAINEGYWGERPFFDTAVVLEVPEASTQALMIQGDEVDIALNIPPDSVDAMKSNSELRVFEQKGLYNEHLRLLNQGDVPTADRNVRRAIAYAMNYPLLLAVRSGDLLPTDGPIPSTFMDGYRAENLYDYDLDKAQEELAKSNYPDGGFTVSVVIPPDSGHYQTAMEILQSELQKLNITLDIQVRDWVPQYLLFLEWKEENDPNAVREIQGQSLGMPPLVLDASNYIGIYDCESGLNFTAYCNSEVDGLIDDAGEADTVEDRNKIYQQAIKLIVEDSPDIYLGRNKTILVAREDIRGVKIHRMWHPYGFDIASISR